MRGAGASPRQPGKFTVLVTTEGTYPFHGGGVSTWCDVMIRGLPDVDFKVMAIIMNPFLRQRYDLPPNVLEVIRAPLWGVEEPMEYSIQIPFSQVYEAKRATTEEVIEAKFIPLFRSLVREILHEGEPTFMGTLFYGLHKYFQKYDYNTTFRARVVWQVFREELALATKDEREELLEGGAHSLFRETGDHISQRYTLPSILEATDGLRLLYRLLIILSHPVPRADVTHSHAAAFCGIPCILAKQAYGTPFLLTEHGVYLREQYLSVGRSTYTYHTKRFLMKIMRAVVHCCYRYADVVLPVCKWNTRWQERHGVPPERIRLIYNGVDPDKFVPMPNIERDPRPTVVTVALVYPLKDIPTLIRSAEITRRRVPDVQFQVYGSTPDPDYYQRCLRLRERLGLEPNFHFMGRTARPQEAYNKGDVIALSSLSEAFPYSVVEAMMCGKPVVSTDVGGVREALRDTGIVVRSRSPEALAEGILRLLTNSQMRLEMGEDARTRALTYFTLERWLRDYRELFESVIRKASPREHAA